MGIAVDLTLVDQRDFWRVDKFDGVFQREDVLAPMLIELIDHRRQGGGFTAAGGPRHQHQAAR